MAMRKIGKMVTSVGSAGSLTLMLLAFAGGRSTASESSSDRTPVLVELFTSEGCSDCPPADALLQKLDQQPLAGADIIVLSEHVDYWNHLGWSDPYSAHLYSERQNAYSRHFGLATVYTPQMIVDGSAEFVGSNAPKAQTAVAAAARSAKQPVRLSAVALEGNQVRLNVEASALTGAVRGADVYVALAQNRAYSRVTAGENAGRNLTHVAVVRSLVRVGTVAGTQTFTKAVTVKLPEPSDSKDLRIVAFVQEAGTGRVLGAVERRVGE